MTDTTIDTTTHAATEFADEWLTWHAEHLHRLADPHGFLAVTALHWLDETPQRFDGVPGAWSTGPQGVVVTLEATEDLAVDGRPVAGTFSFGVIPEREGRNATYGDTVLEVAKRGGHDILRPRHPDHPLRAQFRGTPSYAPDPRWVVEGRYGAVPAPRPTTVGAAVEGLQHVYDAPGRIEFELDGRALALTAFGGYDGGLLVLFTDETSGVTTYAANRALALAAPDGEGRVRLDFNRATNLPCAYTDLATCPLPPAENRLPLAVEAGEQIPYERR
jgi:uncharacterized protein (DUF1684 family)